MRAQNRMRPLDRGLWVAEQPLRFAGLEIGARMTVVRLRGGELLLHSPIRPTAELVGQVRALGPIAALVCPNRFHHLFAAEWMEACPDAALFVAPGLERKRPDLRIAGILSEIPDARWSDALEQVVIQGLPLTNEVVFFHPASRTLIATDLAFNIGPDHPALTRWVFRFAGAYRRLAPTTLERILVRDRARFRRSLERILEWPFERVIVAHGAVLETGGRRELARGFSWVLTEAETARSQAVIRPRRRR